MSGPDPLRGLEDLADMITWWVRAWHEFGYETRITLVVPRWPDAEAILRGWVHWQWLMWPADIE
jgi:hypothetical protein